MASPNSSYIFCLSLTKLLANPLVDTPIKVATIFLLLFAVCILILFYQLEKVKKENKRLKSQLMFRSREFHKSDGCT
jgi:hypothetical protein